MQRSRCALGELAENTPNHTDGTVEHTVERWNSDGTMALAPLLGRSIVRGTENSPVHCFPRNAVTAMGA